MIDSGFQDIVSQARKLLTDSPFIELHKIDVMQSGERVTLRGDVASFFMKQLAQETVRSATAPTQLTRRREEREGQDRGSLLKIPAVHTYFSPIFPCCLSPSAVGP